MLNSELETTLHTLFATAKKERKEYVTIEYALLALLDTVSGNEIYKQSGGDVESLKVELKDFVEKNIPIIPDDMEVNTDATPPFNRVIQRAIMQVQSSGKSSIGVGDLLVAIASEKDSHAAHFMKAQGVTRLDIINFISHGVVKDKNSVPSKKAPEKDGVTDVDDDGEQQADPLEMFATNLNERAKNNKIDPLIGRHDEVERVVQILGRRRKNNPILVGEAGVGKTAIAEGLAKRIVDGDVPASLKDIEIHSLDVGSLVAGTKYRGDFEARLKSLLKKVENNEKIVLFVDEIHTLIGAGGSSGSAMDASNLLKPALSSGAIRCIGATTYSEYRTVFEKEHALARRFQKIDVLEPSPKDTIEIVKGLRPSFESHHGVKYTDEAIEAAVNLSIKYMHDKHLPDKAIDVIDEAGSRQKTVLSDKKKTTITIREIEEVIAKITKIPLETLSSSEKDKLKNLEPEINNTVFGQNDAVKKVVTAVKMSRSGLGGERKPIGSFLFAGPTGVGKTEVARQLSKTMGVELLRFDMSEYMEKHAVSKLIGTPPGYVGYEEGGQLTELVNKNPYCVLLLDEIEKAHPDIYNILLQVMDNGFLTDNNGRKVDFRNAILIMTSNVGAEISSKPRIGFSHNDSDIAKDKTDALKNVFSPEFRNRLDAVIQFKPLERDNIKKIAEKLLNDLNVTLKDRSVELEFSDKLIDYLVEHGFEPSMGARPMNRLVQDLVKSPLSEELLFGSLESGGRAFVDISSDGKVEITPYKKLDETLGKIKDEVEHSSSDNSQHTSAAPTDGEPKKRRTKALK